MVHKIHLSRELQEILHTKNIKSEERKNNLKRFQKKIYLLSNELENFLKSKGALRISGFSSLSKLELVLRFLLIFTITTVHCILWILKIISQQISSSFTDVIKFTMQSTHRDSQNKK